MSAARRKIQGDGPRESEDKGTGSQKKSPIVVNHEFLQRKYEQNISKSSSSPRSGSRSPDIFNFRRNNSSNNNSNSNSKSNTDKKSKNNMEKEKGKSTAIATITAAATTTSTAGAGSAVLPTRLAKDAPIFVIEPAPPASRMPKGTRRPVIHWFDAPEGVYRDVWTSALKPKITALVDTNSRRIPAPRKFTVWFKFRGPSFDRARPTVMITSQTKNSAQYLKQLLTKDAETQDLLKKYRVGVKVGVDGVVMLGKDKEKKRADMYSIAPGISLSQTKLPLDLDEDEDSDAEPLNEPEIESLATMSTAMISPEIISPSTSFLGRPAGSEVLSGSDMAASASDRNKSPTLLPADFPLPASPPLKPGQRSGYMTPPVANPGGAVEKFMIQAVADQRSYRNDLRGMELTVLTLASPNFEDRRRKCTVGGIIMVEGKPYGLTAHHPFENKSRTERAPTGLSTPREFEWLDDEEDEFNEPEGFKDTDTDDDLAFDSSGSYSSESEEDDEARDDPGPPPPKTIYPEADPSRSRKAARPAKPGPGPFAAFESDADADHNDEKRPAVPVTTKRGILSGVVGAAAAFARGSNSFVDRKRSPPRTAVFTPSVEGETEPERSASLFKSVMHTKSRHDWHLVPFEGALGGAKLNVSQSNVGGVAMPSRGSHVACHTGFTGVIGGYVSAHPALYFEGGDWTEVLTVRFSNVMPKPGDSGSWLLDSSSNDMYGHVTSRSESLPLAYASPAARVFEEIATKMNTNIETIQFPRVIQPKENSRMGSGIDLEATERRKLEEVERLGGADSVNSQLRERRERELRAERRRARREKEEDKCVLQ